MNEKDTLVQNVNGALPTAQKMNQLENEIVQLNAKIEEQKKFGCLSVLPAFFAVTLIPSGYFLLMHPNGKKLLGLLLLAIGCVLAYFVFIKRIIRQGQYKKRIAEVQQECEVLRDDATLAWLPAEYRTGSCLNAIISYVQNGRADSLKEALNLLENELHQQRMESAAAVGAYYGAQSGRY